MTLTLIPYKTVEICSKCGSFKTYRTEDRILLFDDIDIEDPEEKRNKMCLNCFKRYIRAKVRRNIIDNFNLLNDNNVNSLELLDVDALDDKTKSKVLRTCMLCGSHTTYVYKKKEQWYRIYDNDDKWDGKSYMCKSCYKDSVRYQHDKKNAAKID